MFNRKLITNYQDCSFMTWADLIISIIMNQSHLFNLCMMGSNATASLTGQ